MCRSSKTNTAMQTSMHNESMAFQQEQAARQQAQLDAARAAEAARQRAIQGGLGQVNRAFNFGPDFFNRRAQEYMNFANPQVDQQFGNAQDQLAYGLSRIGHGQGSSTQSARFGDLDRDYGQARADVASMGQDSANRAREQIAAQRAALSNLVVASGGSGGLGGQISNAAAAIQATPAFSSLGPLFQNATAGLGSFLEGRMFGNTRNNAPQTYSFNDPTGTGRTVRS